MLTKKYALKYLFYARVNYTSIVLIEFADPKDTKIKGRIVYEPVSKISHLQETKDNFIENVKIIKFSSVRQVQYFVGPAVFLSVRQFL